MRALKLVLPAAFLMTGFLVCTTASYGTQEYAKKEKKACTFCHGKIESKEANAEEPERRRQVLQGSRSQARRLRTQKVVSVRSTGKVGSQAGERRSSSAGPTYAEYFCFHFANSACRDAFTVMNCGLSYWFTLSRASTLSSYSSPGPLPSFRTINL